MAAPMCKIHCNNAAKNSKIVESSTYYFMMLVTSDELRLELDLRISIDFKFLFKILMITTLLTISFKGYSAIISLIFLSSTIVRSLLALVFYIFILKS